MKKVICNLILLCMPFIIEYLVCFYFMKIYKKREKNKKNNSKLYNFSLRCNIYNGNTTIMKKIIRLTESDLHNLVQRSVARVLREEQDKNLLLQLLAQSIIQQGKQEVIPGENDAEFQLQGNGYAYVTFEVQCDPYMQRGMKSSSYDVPDDPDEIIDNPTIEIESIDFYNNDGEFQILDNGIVKKALEKVINVNYDINIIPSEDDYNFTE